MKRQRRISKAPISKRLNKKEIFVQLTIFDETSFIEQNFLESQKPKSLISNLQYWTKQTDTTWKVLFTSEKYSGILFPTVNIICAQIFSFNSAELELPTKQLSELIINGG